jgi:hypothetical protein
MHPIYKVEFDEKDKEICFDFNSVVDYPAHVRAFDKYGDKAIKNYFAEQAQMRITGVMIAANVPIYRRCPVLGEHFVVFFPEEIDKLHVRANEFELINNLNRQHDGNDIVKTSGEQKEAFLIEQWKVRPGVGVPVNLSKQGIQDGSLMATYQVRSQPFWQDILAGKYNGFSIEGMFLKSPLTVNGQEFKRHNVALTQDQLDERQLYFTMKKIKTA